LYLSNMSYIYIWIIRIKPCQRHLDNRT
jgi:hypothetical protein